ncbi:SGNH/GDSL hydrolase family protein [Nonomuraea monospora]|uniref:SGNH/GDSL hydrolase family protein n=1 Tax=Nonomuraea monospora TaxID=568818 RepID=A0ABN3D2F9_9ACTN
MFRPLLAAVLGLALTTAPAHADPGGHWVDAWATALHRSSAAAIPPVYDNQTIRMVVPMRGSGNAVRVRLSNAHGDQPVTFGAVTVALSEGGASLAEGTLSPVTFSGASSVTVPAGQTVRSDSIRLHVRTGRHLAVSVYLPTATGPATWHRSAVQTNYVSEPGDHTGDPDGGSFPATMRSWIFLDAVAVNHGPTPGTLVAVGDSITDGSGTKVDGFERWPDRLAARLAAQPGRHPAVVNTGIGGNRVLTDTAQDGQSLLNRLERDVLSRAGLTHVILLEGGNDLRNGATADQLITAYKEIITKVRARGAKIYGGTITPCKGGSGHTGTVEAHRRTVNAWIATSGEFDGVIDFATAVADPLDPQSLAPAYDRGDHLHPNAAGFAAMADAVDLSLLR